MKKFDSRKSRRARKGLLLLIGGVLWLQAHAAGETTAGKAPEQATITSDEFEAVQNGAESIFTGHVVLTRSPYVLHADRMARVQATGIVEAKGHVEGIWIRPTGEKVVAVGDRARYDPNAQTTDLWDHAKLTRWETAVDTSPMVATANHFLALLDQDVLVADGDVHISRTAAYWTQSDWAKYEKRSQQVHLWGQTRTITHWEDAQGTGHFLSDKAILYLSPKRAQLIDNVTGRVTPAK